jgi:hypothetical protein
VTKGCRTARVGAAIAFAQFPMSPAVGATGTTIAAHISERFVLATASGVSAEIGAGIIGGDRVLMMIRCTSDYHGFIGAGQGRSACSSKKRTR